jgi:uncharacterized membrane protein
MLTSFNILVFIATLLCGMVAGLLYGYDCSVILGLGRLSDKAYLEAFQSINSAIQNPYFFVSFMGTLFLLPFSTWYSHAHSPACFPFLLTATLIYIVGVMGVTMLGNIPLNEALANFNIPSASETALAQQRKIFESLWNNYHRIRTLAALLSFSFLILSILKK